jgi:hypothetical protein
MELSISENEVEPKKNTYIKSILKLDANPNTTIQNSKTSKRVSYDDILAKMGMYVDNGKLHLDKNNCSSNSSNYIG